MTSNVVPFPNARADRDCMDLPNVVPTQEFKVKMCIALGLTIHQAAEYLYPNGYQHEVTHG